MKTYLKMLLFLALLFWLGIIIARTDYTEIAMKKSSIGERAAKITSTNHIATITIESIKPYREAIKKLEAISNDTVISGQVKFWANLEISSLIVKIQEIVKNKKGLMWNDICIVCGTIKE